MKVAVFGAGTMGSGIAQVFAAKGHTALMYASSVASAQRHKDKLAASLEKRVQKGKMTAEAKEDLLSRVLVEEKSACADADLIIECVKEDMATKKELLNELDALCKPEAIFASNTSSLSITEMGHGLKHPVIGMHFFNPVPSMKLVEIIRGAIFDEEYQQMVLVKDIDLYSTCEHHMMPFIGKCHIAYIPNGKITGLSKIARVVETFARRLQVQERLTVQIRDCIEEALHPLGVAVVIEASHTCMQIRGVEKANSITTTSAFSGAFLNSDKTRNEFLNLIK